ncbi:MAG: hypothetical protein B6242_11050 [Anaerolineaceae bacterium 4572_78]|nr:MAG: hypothetical protein B6242_11050 [Anaerolineaceae bacterium 4572_78]
MVGRSDLHGFTLYGNVKTDDVTHATSEALQRMKNGEKNLAVHSRCGTVLATTGILTGLATFLSISMTGNPNRRFRWAALPEAILAATFAAVVAQPLGLAIQARYTVTADVEKVNIVSITRNEKRGLTTHRITTTQS